MNKHIDLNLEALEAVEAPLLSDAEMIVTASAIGSIILVVAGGIIIT